MLKDQRGLTLVELLVAIVIASIVAITVGGFMVVAARTFTSTSSEVNLQHESQIAFNQLQDLIIDTTLGVDYVYIEEGDTAEINILSDADIPGGTVVGEKRIYIYNDTVAYAVIWDADVRELFYEEYDVTYSSTGGATFGATRVSHALMAEFITDFGIDVTRLEAKNIVRVDMAFERANRNYSASYNITVRNKVVVNGDPATFTPTLPVPDGLESTDFIYVEPGRTYDLATELDPKVTCSTLPSYSSKEVVWRLDTGAPPVSARTGIDLHSGLLSVSSAEPGGSFQVVIAAKTGIASKTVTVYVVRVETITFPTDAFEKASDAVDENGNGIFYDDMKAGETFTLKAIVDGPNVAKACVTDPTIHYVNWAAATKSMPYVEPVGSGSCTTGVVGGSTVGIVTCQFRIKEADDLVTDAANPPVISIEATSQRSIDASYPYQNEAGVNEPVIGKWEAGKYYKKPYDYIITGSSLYRGGEPVIGNTDNLGVNRLHYFFIYTLKVTERLYQENGTVTERQLSDSEIGKFYDNSWGSTNLKLKLTTEYLNPNADYIFEVECYLMNPKQTWHAGNSALYGTDVAREYDISQAVAVGGGYKELLNRVKIYFNSQEKVIYYPREFGVGKDAWNNFIENVRKEYKVETKEGTIKTNEYNNGSSIALYQYTNGKWTKYTTPFDKNMFTELQFNSSSDGHLIYRYYYNRWVNNMPLNLRMIPTVKDKSGKEYLMFDSYVDLYTWNIKVDKSWMGLSTYNEWICTEECYFPSPLDSNFPGVTAAGTKLIWSFPYTTTAENQQAFRTVRSQTITYTITKQNNADDTVRYNLTLYQPGTDTKIGTYYCDSNSRVWTKN